MVIRTPAWSRRYHELAVRHTINLGGKDLLSAAQSVSCGARPPWDVSWSRWREECRLANRSTSTASPRRFALTPYPSKRSALSAGRATRRCRVSLNAPFSP